MAWKIPNRLTGDSSEIMAMRLAPLAVQRQYHRKWFRQIAADELTRPGPRRRGCGRETSEERCPDAEFRARQRTR
jgi:hypothetical protein